MPAKPALCIFVHDVWNGQAANLLRTVVPELTVITAGPGYTRRRLTDYVLEHTPDAVLIAAPCWHAPHDVLVSRYHVEVKHIPLLYLVDEKLWRLPEDLRQLDFFIPASERVLSRSQLTAEAFMRALSAAINT